MGNQQILMVVVGVIIVSLAIALGISLFAAQQVAWNRDAMITDLQHISLMAYQYRTNIRALGGGQGDYTSFSIPSNMRSNGNGTYSIKDPQVNSLTLQGISSNNAANIIIVTVDSYGKLGDLTFEGDFK
jgi:type II secretory pathway pseudopilin PulG